MDMVELTVWGSLIGSVVILVFLAIKIVKLMNTTHSDD